MILDWLFRRKSRKEGNKMAKRAFIETAKGYVHSDIANNIIENSDPLTLQSLIHEVLDDDIRKRKITNFDWNEFEKNLYRFKNKTIKADNFAKTIGCKGRSGLYPVIYKIYILSGEKSEYDFRSEHMKELNLKNGYPTDIVTYKSNMGR